MPLYVVATPIGNLDDVSTRMRDILGRATAILCEDTRRTRTLLSALDISAPPLISCHAHNEEGRTAAVNARLEAGEDVAMVSDAGMPGISDPGGVVVSAAHAAGHPVFVVAGPSSVVAALAVSGLNATPFHFLGFPPRKAGALRTWLKQASTLEGSLVMLESGRRIGHVISAAAEMLPDREACICRELTKKHEEVLRGSIRTLPQTEQRGEVVLVIGPGLPASDVLTEPVGPDLKTIAGALAERWGCKKREAYQALLELEQARKD